MVKLLNSLKNIANEQHLQRKGQNFIEILGTLAKPFERGCHFLNNFYTLAFT